MSKQLEIFMDPNTPESHFPEYKTKGAAGFDISAWIPTGTGKHIIRRGETQIIGTGTYIFPPEGYEVQVRSRSGLAFKRAVFVTNGPGTIDCDYRGECNVVLTNLGPSDYVVSNGDRIAQGVLKKAPQAQLVRVQTINHDTDRGDSGFGSTGD